MTFDSALRLLCDTFRKSRVPVSFLTSGSSLEQILGENFKLLFGSVKTPSAAGLFDKIQPKRIYRFSSSVGFQYLFLLLPQTPRPTVLAIGPYVSQMPDKGKLLEIGERYGIAPHRQKLLETYYISIPHLSESSHLFVLLDTFAEQLWGAGGFTVVDLNEELLMNNRGTSSELPGETEDVLLKMKLMEERYAAENQLIRAVASGQVHKRGAIMGNLAGMPFEKRLDDPLRNLKNYTIIMNTLLRKGAEQGGVHPLYLDEMSSDFAKRIEQVPSVGAVHQLMAEMYRSYCLLVQKNAMKYYSTPVQKAVLMIDTNLSGDVSLRTLAQAQNINASYLSNVFKKETGRTVTGYINGKRMELAARLLTTTNLQIQTVALHCGMVDVQYFSKLFKKHFGKTPKEYRDENKK